MDKIKRAAAVNRASSYFHESEIVFKALEKRGTFKRKPKKTVWTVAFLAGTMAADKNVCDLVIGMKSEIEKRKKELAKEHKHARKA